MAFLIFFSIVFTVYFYVQYYLFSRLSMVFPGTAGIAFYVKTTFWVLASAFLAGRVLEKIWLSEFTMGITIVGSYWLAAMIYFLLAAIVIDLVRLADLAIPFFPSHLSNHLPEVRRYLFLIVIAITGILIIYGHFNARRPVVNELTLNIPKQAGERAELNIVLVSDIHLGTVLAKKRLNRIVNKINQLNPDIVLMAGDVIDEDLDPVIRKDLGSELEMLKPALGVYAVTGNHEYIGGIGPAVEYLESHGIHLIRDSTMLIDNSFYLIGREDRDRPRFSGKPRKDLAEIMFGVNKDLPLILMDHQPFTLAESQQNGVDLHLSGHTHNGQMWPLNYIIDAIYEVGWGYKYKTDMHVYVSSGVGTWGPPIRIGTHPEIVNIKLKFQRKDNT